MPLVVAKSTTTDAAAQAMMGNMHVNLKRKGAQLTAFPLGQTK